ncbi:unnamed protein product [Phyllotreta striolata]|uniref:Condensin complex subunit 1 n=1 Tax=Phyllotreta striolata TaxID=444603 RepID=A0A9N9XW17_PHYSR|nr:unnamed protein product [Phyllotreta striolata]
MVPFTFMIPPNKEELLECNSEYYFVRNVLSPEEIPEELKRCKFNLTNEGAEFVLSSFDTYFSVLHNGQLISRILINQANQDLLRGVSQLNKEISILLEDKDSLTPEITAKFLNVLKMIIYLFTETVLFIENQQRSDAEKEPSKRGKKKSNDVQISLEKPKILGLLYEIITKEISCFWEDKMVEQSFLSTISNLCYEFLKDPSIKDKNQSDTFNDIFNILGHLIQNYNHGSTFMIKLISLIKQHEHLTLCVPKGIEYLVKHFNFKSLLSEFVKELTEWQMTDNSQDSLGSRNCSAVLTALAALLPDLMRDEVTSLNKYLFFDSNSLRISVLMVMLEVILNVLTKHDLEDREKELRDTLFDIVMEHCTDQSALVRGRVFSQLARFQKANAIPLKFQRTVLEKAVEHLTDTSPIARKCAANCVTTFLSFNVYGAQLSLSSTKAELEETQKKLTELQAQLSNAKLDEVTELQANWDKVVGPLQNELQQILTDFQDEDGDIPEEIEEQCRLPEDECRETIRKYLISGQFKEAFLLMSAVISSNTVVKSCMENEGISTFEMYMRAFHMTFFNFTDLVEQFQNNRFDNISEDDQNRLASLTARVDFLTNCFEFLSLIDRSIDRMVQLLETTSASDMHEALEFFAVLNKFNIDRSSEGICAILKLMQRNEQERKVAALNCLKNIYLITNTENISDHVTIVVDCLVRLVKSIPVVEEINIEKIISMWVSQGVLDNACIERLWHIFTRQVKLDEDDEIVATDLLRMASHGSKAIIRKNINLVSTVAFGERGRKNLKFLSVCCDFLANAYEKIDIASNKPPFKITCKEKCFSDLLSILTDLVSTPVGFYCEALFSGLDFVYKLSKKPSKFSYDLIEATINEYNKRLGEENSTIPTYFLIRICQMFGYVAVRELEFMNDVVYKELKILNAKQPKNNKNVNKRKTLLINKTLNTSLDEIEGAEAYDDDADFVLGKLETLPSSGPLNMGVPLILSICQRPDKFNNEDLQKAATTALARYMLVSNKFCDAQMSLWFTILEKTTYPEVKVNALVFTSDLLSRFPNSIEPWINRLYKCLTDPLPKIRRATFFVLSHLILTDMIRAQNHLPKMAVLFNDSDESLRDMCHTFFLKLSHKLKNISNIIPDVLDYFTQEKFDSKTVRSTMKILFDLTESNKYKENIITRFCSKFPITDDSEAHNHISYCLSLIKYNEKTLKRLIEEFPMYKNYLCDEEIYSNFKQIMQNCNRGFGSKQDLKSLTAELEKLITASLGVNDDSTVSMPPPAAPRSHKKQTQKENPKKKQKRSVRRKRVVSSDSESDGSE